MKNSSSQLRCPDAAVQEQLPEIPLPESNVSDLCTSAVPERKLSSAGAESSLRREEIQHESELPADER